MKLTFLLQSLRKSINLQEQHTDAFLSSLICDSIMCKYIRENILPRIERDQEFQEQVVARELKRLMEEMKDERETDDEKERN